ncbi:NUDIX hydrolase [Clostridium sp. DJ247]|uniref:NUDIX hydrolase n=1 Tax=Clostridium sp. DJ247 TaxID=2726188 RepID=UPI0016267845|nr:NUDIX hydrolase [Clostridium sp. DJ247]MBC2582627.1 NUDIX hydrolase [Clostridium sp. DJ247]
MKNNKITKLTVLAETKYLSLFDAEYKNKKGTTKHWTVASRKCYETLKGQYFQGKEENMDAVIIAAVHKESEKLALIKQFRIPLNDFIYELPAGLIDNNESIETAVARELKEETGLSLLEIDREKTKKGVYVSAGMTDESVALVYCTCAGEITNEYLEDDEDIEAILVSRSEAEELLKEDVKMDIKAYMALQSFINS